MMDHYIKYWVTASWAGDSRLFRERGSAFHYAPEKTVSEKLREFCKEGCLVTVLNPDLSHQDVKHFLRLRSGEYAFTLSALGLVTFQEAGMHEPWTSPEKGKGQGAPQQTIGG